MAKGGWSVIIPALVYLILFGYVSECYCQAQSNATGQAQSNATGQAQPNVAGQAPETTQVPSNPRTIRGSQPRVRSPFTQSGVEVIVDLSVTPTVYEGPCSDVAFTFKGQIYANKVMAVKYKFVRSDGLITEAKTLAFDKPGSQEVTYTWKMGDNLQPPAFSGSVFLDVLASTLQTVQSNNIAFTGTCTGEPKP